MSDIEDWRYSDQLLAEQIAMLMAGYNPALFRRDTVKVAGATEAFLHAVQTAVKIGAIKASIATLDYQEATADDIDWDRTLIEVASLTQWLVKKGKHDKFFVRHSNAERNGIDDPISNRRLPHYAIKLDAAVQAWRAVSADPKLLHGKSPKQALRAWLIENGHRFGLVDENGKPNESGIEEITKVANWKLKGGATPTPSTVASAEPTGGFAVRGGRDASNPPTRSGWDDLDDDIPF